MATPQDLTRHERIVMNQIAMEHHDHPVRFWIVVVVFFLLLGMAIWILLGIIPLGPDGGGPTPHPRAPLPRIEHGL